MDFNVPHHMDFNVPHYRKDFNVPHRIPKPSTFPRNIHLHRVTSNVRPFIAWPWLGENVPKTAGKR
jgi:hypothetical protein